MRRSAFSRYEQFETSPESIEQELRCAVWESSATATDRFKKNYSIDGLAGGTNVIPHSLYA